PGDIRRKRLSWASFAGSFSKKRSFGRVERLFRETWFISVERCSHPEKAQAWACAAGELCRGISTESYISSERKTSTKAFPIYLFLRRFPDH
ncbi:MAG: hypothetical protein J0G97_21865, partial [Rhizobium pusense]|nr:hypothetical protein [Agrobacterium pusense]